MIDSYLAPPDLAAARLRVRAAVEARCRRLAAGSGRSSGSSGVDGLADQDDVVTLDPGTPFEQQRHRVSGATACVVADLVLWRWDRASLRALADRLGPETALVFLEPTADLGWRRVVHRLGRLPARLLLGHHFEADLPAELRAAGLVVTTADRFQLGPAGIRSYVWGQAEHIKPIGPRGADEA